MPTLFETYGIPDFGTMPPPSLTDAGDFARGVKESFQQLPQLGYGLVAGVGAAGETMFGEGGMSTSVKKAGVEGYQRWGDKIAANAKPSDSFNYSWDQAKQGDFGALVDWLQHGIGYVGGQGLQMLATAGVGSLAGKLTAGTAAKTIAEGMVAKEAAKIGAETTGRLTAGEITKQATALVAQKFATLGANAAVGAAAFGQEGGEIFGDLTQEATKQGRTLTGDELAKAFGATLAAGGLEFVGDKIGLDIVLGKSRLLKPTEAMKGLGGRLARGAVAAAGAAPIEAGTEFGQTLAEKYGKGKDPFSAESMAQASDAAALGALGGTVIGGGGGMLHGPKNAEADKTPDKIPEILAADSIDQSIASASQALDAPISERTPEQAIMRMEAQAQRDSRLNVNDWSALGTAPVEPEAEWVRQARETAAADQQQIADEKRIRSEALAQPAEKELPDLGGTYERTLGNMALDAQARQDEQRKQAETEAIPEMARQQDARTAALQRAATLEGESSMAAAMRRAGAVEQPVSTQAAPESQTLARAEAAQPSAQQDAQQGVQQATQQDAQPVPVAEPRLVERTPDMQVTSRAKAEAMAAADPALEAVRVQNHSGKFAYAVLVPPGTQAADLTTVSGEPYATRLGVILRGRKEGHGHTIVAVRDGFVVRPPVIDMQVADPSNVVPPAPSGQINSNPQRSARARKSRFPSAASVDQQALSELREGPVIDSPEDPSIRRMSDGTNSAGTTTQPIDQEGSNHGPGLESAERPLSSPDAKHAREGKRQTTLAAEVARRAADPDETRRRTLDELLKCLAGGTLTGCLRKAGASLHADDRPAILARAADLRRQGLHTNEASRTAVSERIDAVLNSATGQHPSSLAASTGLGESDREGTGKPAHVNRIDDTGEKIGGARKDRWAERGMTVEDLDAMSEAEGATVANKANVWKPDYAAIAEQADPVTAAMVKVVYDALAAKPRQDTPQGRRDYVRAMQAVRKVYGAVRTVQEAKDAYRALRDELGLPAVRMGLTELSESQRDARRALFAVYKGRSDPFVFGYNELARAKKLVETGFPGAVEPWTRRFAIRQYGGQGLTSRGVELLVRDAQQAGTPMDEAQFRAGYFEVRDKAGHTLAYLPTKEDAEQAAKALYEKAKNAGDDGKKEPERPHLDNIVREGLAQSIDRDVTPEDMISAFGFRGIEFGNWGAQDERQRLLNMAYDALSDLAKILNVPRRALSLNGTLGMAFGARGSGRFAAHYEPGKLVINMTKLRGAGSLAHEWAHAFDHYLGELDTASAYQGEAKGVTGWRTQRSYTGRTAPQNLRPELASALDAVMRRLYEGTIDKATMLAELERGLAQTREFAAGMDDPKLKNVYTDSIAQQQARIDEVKSAPDGTTYPRGKSDFSKQAQKLSGKSADGYWLRPTEMWARAFESYVFDRLVAMGAKSEYLVHGVEQDRYTEEAGYKGNPYPTGAERAAINAAFDSFVAELKTRETEAGTALFNRADDRLSAAEAAAILALPQSTIDRVLGRFSLADAKAMAETFGPGFQVVQSVSDLPDDRRTKVLEKAPSGEVRGAYFKDGDQIWLIKDHIHSRAEFMFVGLHESFHRGLAKTIGPDAKRLLKAMYLTNGKLRNATERQMKRHKIGLDEAIEEALADMAGKGEARDLKGWAKLVELIRGWLSKVGEALGVEINWSDDMIADFVAGTTRAGFDGDQLHLDEEKSPSFGRTFGLQLPRVSRPTNDSANSVLTQSDLAGVGYGDPKTSRLPVDERAALTAQDLVNASGGVFDFNRLGATRQDRVRTVVDGARPFFLGALTRDQLADIYGQEVPQVKDYDALTRSMENERSKIAQDADAIYNQWATLGSEVNDKLARVMLDATVHSVHPDGAFTDIKGNDAATETERRKVHMRLRRDFRELPGDAQAMYCKVRDFHARLLEQLRAGLQRRIERQVQDGKTRAATLTGIRQAFDQYKENGPYFPLSRFGDFLVIASRPDGERVVASYETAGEQAAAARALRDDGFTVKTKAAKQYSRALDGSAGRYAGDVLTMLNGLDMSDATVGGKAAELKTKLMDDVNQLFIRALPDLSYRRHFAHRKNTPGFSADVMRGFASSAFHAANHIARLNHADRMTFALEDAYRAVEQAGAGDFNQHTQVLNELAKRHDAAMNPNTHPIAAMLNQVGFVMYLGASPAAGLIQLLQNPMITMPYLGARYGFADTTRAMAAATRDIMGAKPNRSSGWDAAESPKLTARERETMRKLQGEGVIDLSQAHDLAAATSLDAGNVARSKAAFAMARAMRIVGWTFHVPEVINRQVAALTAYRLELAKSGGQAAAEEAARDAIRRTHFDYSASNRARFMQGNLARVVLQFKQYAQNISYLLGRAAYVALRDESPEVRAIARRQLVATFAVTFGMAGALGLPGLGMAGGLLGLLIGALDGDDKPWDWKVEFRNFTADAFGKELGEVISHGVPRALMPWDLSSRVGLSDLWFRSSDREGQSPRDAFATDMTNILGPTAGSLLGWYTATDHMAKGNWAKAAESIVPKFVRDAIQAGRIGTEGVTSYSGEHLTDVTGAEVLGKLLGFAPARVSEMFEARNAVKNAETAIMERRQLLVSRAAQARITGDSEGLAEVMDAIQSFNQRNPQEAIKPSAIASSVMARRRHERQTIDGTFLPKSRDHLREIGRFAEVE